MNRLLEQIYETGFVEDRAGNQLKATPTSIPMQAARALDELVRRQPVEQSIEIGFAYGLSALVVCQALHETTGGLHTAIDPYEEKRWGNIGLANIERAGLQKHFSLLETYSHLALAELVAQERTFEFAFIDGQHLFDYVLVDFFYVDKLLQVGSYVVLDDMWMESVKKVVSFVSKNLQYVIEPRPDVPNLCVMKKIGRDTREWSFHVPF